MKSDRTDRFRTTVPVPISESRIDYSTPVAFIGSCFSSEMSAQMAAGKMKVLSNPFGTVYNPLSVARTIDIILDKKVYTKKDLVYYGGRFLSLDHYTSFSSANESELISSLNDSVIRGADFLADAKHLFITFGTAWVYKLKESGRVVSNCHRIPATGFDRFLLKPEEVVSVWKKLLNRIGESLPDLEVWFTISPVRHWKDGPHGNQISKATLHLAVEELLSHRATGGYFPSYEIVMDELRDYRYYADDMLHPSRIAIDYIWDKFTESFCDNKTIQKWKTVRSVTQSLDHRIMDTKSSKIREYADAMLSKISKIEAIYSDVKLQDERDYFISVYEQNK